MHGGFLKLTLETTEVNISTGSAVVSPSVRIVSSHRLWAALTLLKSPCAARMFRWAGNRSLAALCPGIRGAS